MNLEYPIYCINLLERTDRKENVINEFSKLNIDCSNVKFPDFNRDVRGGKYGCYDSHVKIWKDFYLKSSNKFCLIFEDDFIVNDYCKDLLIQASIFMQNNYNDVDFLFLHNLFIKNNEKKNNAKSINNEYFTKGFGLLAHAYFISRNYIDILVKQCNYEWMLPDGYDIDFTINCNRKHCLYSNKCFFANQQMFTQILNPSNNCETILDVLYRLPIIQFIGKDFLQNVIEICESLNICNENEIKDQIYHHVYMLQNSNNNN
jgi:hypothetical protein